MEVNKFLWKESLNCDGHQFHKSKKEKQHTGQKKKVKRKNNDLQNITHTTKHELRKGK